MHHGQLIFQGRPEQGADDPVVVDTYLGAGATGRLKRFFEERRADA